MGVTNKLSTRGVASAQPREKAYKLGDGGALFLEVRPNGSKWWRMPYRYGGKQKLLALGVYPLVSLAEARQRRDDAKRQLLSGVDPIRSKIAAKRAGANTFGDLARQWLEKRCDHLSADHRAKQVQRLEKHLLPLLGPMPVQSITTADILEVLEPIEARGHRETAHRMRSICRAVLAFAIQTRRLDRNPADDLQGALRPVVVTHRAALTDPADVAKLLRAIDASEDLGILTKSALQLAPMFFVRPGELRQAEWSHIDFKSATWSIPAERMKMRKAHVVPLATQALEILKRVQLVSGGGRYVFPGSQGATCMSDGTMNKALRKLGYPGDVMTSHGFRALARTILREQLDEEVEYIERQLAHVTSDPLKGAYDRTKFLKQRRRMMQEWADYLEGLAHATHNKLTENQ